MQTLTITQPDDWHTHLRDEPYLHRTVSDTCQYFARAIVMPNLTPPITTVEMANAYKARILAHIPAGKQFTPLMTLYITEQLERTEIEHGKQTNAITACKLYPAGATTNSAAGVSNLSKIYPLLEVMQAVDMPLLIHGESIDPHADIFDREKLFIDEQLCRLLDDFPNLRIVLEHITTAHAVEFIKKGPDRLAATITPQHLLHNRNALFKHGLNPHFYCLPILKRDHDQQALVAAATSGHPRFFLGSDSAPHARHTKESSCGCAGIYSAIDALPLYTEVFAANNALDKLEAFASINGATFYQLPLNQNKITLINKPWQVPKALSFGEHVVVPLAANETLHWQLDNNNDH